MKIRQLLFALMLGLALTVPASPGSQAIPSRSSVEPASHAVGVPAQLLATGPTPTPGAPPPPAGERPDAALPEAISDVPGVTGECGAAVQPQIRGDLYSLTADEAEGGPPPTAAITRTTASTSASRPGVWV